MRRNKQNIVDPNRGDCFPACLTSILDIPLDPKIPTDETWFVWWHKFLGQFGLTLRYDEKACWRNGYWIASVPSLNYPKVTHAIVMRGSEVVFDPSTKKRYPRGKSLLGEQVVLGGHSLEVTDPTKLHLLDEYRLSTRQ